MATSNKSKKILEKARKVAAKTKKKKVSKAEKTDVKKKTTFYPEGQNAPQSKKYTQESDKTLSAKATGWRWTKEGAKKVGKPVESKPTTSDIEKYRNETFKLKGKPNKSGPKGVGDGSHRYLYVERRADKADITRKNKLEDGGEMAKGGEVKKGDVVKIQGKDFKVVNKFDSMGTKKYFLVPTDDTKDKYGFLSAMTLTEKELASNTQMAKGGKLPRINDVREDGKLIDSQMIDEGYVSNAGEQEFYEYEGKKYVITTWNDRAEEHKDGEEEIQLWNDEMARGGKIPSSEVAEFKNYVKDYYGEGGIFSEFFPPVGVSSKEVNLAVNQYIDYCKTKDDQWGGGDTFDREIVRDIMLYNRGTKKGLEYQRAIKEIFGKDKKEYGGILQPMTGGVNADPRFDIYNTTMFAEKGAELAKGGRTHEINIEDGDDVKFSFKKKTLLEIYESDDSELDNPVREIFNEGEVFEVTVFGIDKHKYDVQFGDGSVAFIRKADVNVIEVNGEKYSKGGKTHEQGYDDREDESLAMRHGKIASKDFVGSHARREHSRRDDAHFETRHKKAYGGLTDSSIELLD